MQNFSIRQIELLTGIKSHTLRIWEKRYRFFKAQRKESNLRFYTNDDLKKLLSISFLYHNGWKISKIATLSDEQIAEEAAGIPFAINNFATAVQQLLRAAIDFNEADFTAILNGLIDDIGLEHTVVNVCYPYMVRVGMLWDTSRIIPAQEHFSSYLIQNKIISKTEQFAVMQNGNPEIVLFCPENEHHELPLLFINYLLRKQGWRVLYLGPNIMLNDLKEAAAIPGIRFLYLHLITNFTGFTIDDYLAHLRQSFPDKIIIASGKGVENSQRNFVDLHLLRRDDDIYRFIQSGGSQPAGSKQ